MAMDPFNNTPRDGDQAPADLFGGSMVGTMTGGTPNAMPGITMADLSKDAIRGGSASDGAAPELTPDPFDNFPPDHSDM